MKQTILALAAAATLAGCSSFYPSQPAVFPGAPAGTLEFVNQADETYVISFNRCGAENQGISVDFDGAPGVYAPAGETVLADMSLGCYIGYVGPNRITNTIREVRLEIVPAEDGYVRVYSDGRAETVPAE